jgi:thymidylate synthase
MMIAHVLGLKTGTFVHSVGDAHIYNNHIEQVKTQLTRTPKNLPTVTLDKAVNSMFDFTYDSIHLNNYHPHSALKGKVSI